jgi:hypothetical protein
MFEHSRWYYQTSSQLHGSTTTGLVSRYGGGGFVQDLTANYDDASAEINDLKANLWIDRGTRVVFLDFTVYNANINLFCQIKLTVEFPASGGAIPSKSFSTVKLIRVSSIQIPNNEWKEKIFLCYFSMSHQWIILSWHVKFYSFFSRFIIASKK